jgi:AGCS family alanine or glycine:cation symporter
MDFAKFASELSGLVWGLPLIVLLFGTHVFLTIRTGFIQRFLPQAIKLSFSREKEGEGDVSQFGALMTALAATIGAGNIIGVAGAVATGGPGAVFWMWLTGVFGIATKYSEAVLAVKYRVQMPDGSYAGGPMYALERGMGQKWLGIVFAAFTCIAAFGIGNMFQANAVVETLKEWVKPGVEAESVLRWVAGLVMAAITGAVILGGVKSIAKVCGCSFHHGGRLSHRLHSDFDQKRQSAAPGIQRHLERSLCRSGGGGWFPRGHDQAGGAVRHRPRFVFQRIGSGQRPHRGGGGADAESGAAGDGVLHRHFLGHGGGVRHHRLVIVSSGHWKEGMAKGALTNAAFEELHTIGPIFLLFGLMTFVFSSILGWCYYGEKAAEYLMGTRAVKPYRVLWVIMVLVGSVQPAAAVMDFSDAANGLMAIPNLISLICLSGVIAAETKAHRDDLTGKS